MRGYRLSIAVSIRIKYEIPAEKKEADPEGSASMVFRALTNQRFVSYTTCSYGWIAVLRS